jgi:serine phosphatase RsbU (regulator of sigma subunit)
LKIKPSHIIYLLGLLGAVLFFSFRPQIDYYAKAPLELNRKDVQTKVQSIVRGLGVELDTLASVATLQQHTKYAELQMDTLDFISPGSLNEKDRVLKSWDVILAPKGSYNQNPITAAQIFNPLGSLRVRVDHEGNIIRIQQHPTRENPTFLTGGSIEDLSEGLIVDMLGYDLEDFEPVVGEWPDLPEEVSNELERLGYGDEEPPVTGQEEILLRWQRISPGETGPYRLALTLKPEVKEYVDESGVRTSFGYQVVSFNASRPYEPLELSNPTQDTLTDFDYALYASAVLLALIVFIFGVRNVIKGNIEWNRAFVMFISLTLGIYGWRMLYFISNFSEVLSTTGYFVISINTLLLSLVLSLFGSLAYVNWEVLARAQKSGEIQLLDGMWRMNIWVKEIGQALINGFLLGFFILGIFALSAKLSGQYLYQFDSAFGFTEASNRPQWLSMNISLWTTTWLVGFAQIGFIISLVQSAISNRWVSGIISFLLVTLLITVLGRLIGSPDGLQSDLLLYAGVGASMVIIYRSFGLVTVNTTWWVFSAVLLLLPYVGTSNASYLLTFWAQSIMILSIPIAGFVMYRNGESIDQVEDYVPEYQERIAQHLRVEKEIEIARESQYQLMPLQPPQKEGLDVFGFFLPSFEVGGDFYDYLLVDDQESSDEWLMMAIVDVSGKAMRAAMPAIFTSGLLLSRIREDAPEKILSDVARPIFERTDKRTFITCAITRYNLTKKELMIANAGHCKPILVHNGKASFIETPAPRYPLGVVSQIEYQSTRISVQTGDVFLLYSDGLPEAVNDKGERLGFDTIPKMLEDLDTQNMSAKEIALHFKRYVQKYSNYQLVDDTTLICLKI